MHTTNWFGDISLCLRTKHTVDRFVYSWAVHTANKPVFIMINLLQIS